MKAFKKIFISEFLELVGMVILAACMSGAFVAIPFLAIAMPYVAYAVAAAGFAFGIVGLLQGMKFSKCFTASFYLLVVKIVFTILFYTNVFNAIFMSLSMTNIALFNTIITFVIEAIDLVIMILVTLSVKKLHPAFEGFSNFLVVLFGVVIVIIGVVTFLPGIVFTPWFAGAMALAIYIGYLVMLGLASTFVSMKESH